MQNTANTKGPRLWHITVTWEQNAIDVKKDFILGATNEKEAEHIVKTRIETNEIAKTSSTIRIRDLGRLQAPFTYFSSDIVLIRTTDNMAIPMALRVQTQLAVLWGKTLHIAQTTEPENARLLSKLSDKKAQQQYLQQWAEEYVTEGYSNIDNFFQQKIDAYILAKSTPIATPVPMSQPKKTPTIIHETTTLSQNIPVPSEPQVEPQVQSQDKPDEQPTQTHIPQPDMSMFEDDPAQTDESDTWQDTMPPNELSESDDEPSFGMPDDPTAEINETPPTEDSEEIDEEPESPPEEIIDVAPDNIVVEETTPQPPPKPVHQKNSEDFDKKMAEAQLRNFMTAALSQCTPELLQTIMQELEATVSVQTEDGQTVLVTGNAHLAFRNFYLRKQSFKTQQELTSCIAQFIATRCNPIKNRPALTYAYNKYCVQSSQFDEYVLS